MTTGTSSARNVNQEAPRLSDEPRNLPIGRVLLDLGHITQDDLQQALNAQRQLGGLLGQTLVRLGALSERDLLAALSRQLGLPVAASEDLPDVATVLATVETVSASLSWLLERDAVIWIASAPQESSSAGNSRGGHSGGERLHVAARHPLDPAIQEAAEGWHAEPAVFHLAGQQTLESLLSQLGKARDEENADSALGGASETQRLREMAQEAPVIDFVNAVFSEALARRASDVHIEPFEDKFVVRLRIDGVLSAWRTAPRSLFDAVASRIKLLSGMDIAERRLPQDGRQSIRISGRELDLRVSALPTTWGESLVLRLLGKTNSLPQLDALGILADQQAMLRALIEKPNGVILVTGPTGSGKTTTIYRLLNELNDGVRKIITVEDPVEFDLPGVVQVQVRADIGLTFAAGLRSILRQDPDVILVGEIRDSETARIAVQSALTGHLVISTVHTNSALASVSRLLDLGVEDYLLADVLRGLVGQRLLRRLCAHCAADAPTREADAFEAEARRRFGDRLASPPAWKRSVGCPKCDMTGFKGRVGAYEVAAVTDVLAEAVRQRKSEAEIETLSRQGGFRSMFEDGLLKARMGMTTMAEAGRVAGASGS
jgi:general secretion pathway protein E